MTLLTDVTSSPSKKTTKKTRLSKGRMRDEVFLNRWLPRVREIWEVAFGMPAASWQGNSDDQLSSDTRINFNDVWWTKSDTWGQKLFHVVLEPCEQAYWMSSVDTLDVHILTPPFGAKQQSKLYSSVVSHPKMAI